MIQYSLDNITPLEDENSYMVDVTIELEDFETSTDTVYVTINFSVTNESDDVSEIREKAILQAKSILKKVLLEDAQRELF